MIKTPQSFWFSQICNYGLYPCLTLLSELEDIEEYEICADIFNAIKWLDVNLPEEKQRPTRESTAWHEYAKFWTKQKVSPILVADEMARIALKELIEFYGRPIKSYLYS